MTYLRSAWASHEPTPLDSVVCQHCPQKYSCLCDVARSTSVRLWRRDTHAVPADRVTFDDRGQGLASTQRLIPRASIRHSSHEGFSQRG